MALFGLGKKADETKKVVPDVKEKKEKKTPAAKSASPASTKSGNRSDLTHILVSPRITEKATMHSAQGVYVFDVDGSATKSSVAQAVIAHYKVTPRMVRVVTIPRKVKRSMRTGKTGIKHGGKKHTYILKKASK